MMRCRATSRAMGLRVDVEANGCDGVQLKRCRVSEGFEGNATGAGGRAGRGQGLGLGLVAFLVSM